jgi:hypothetical protein
VAQKNKPGTELGIKKAKGVIKLDGVLDEADWQDALVATNFFMNYPVDTALAAFQSEARLTYDDHMLYVSFVCYDDSKPDVVQSLKRDFDFGSNDNIGIYFGPYNDGLNGFFFCITPRGVQQEGTISSGGISGDSYNTSWDNKWYSKVVKYQDKWIAELAIPFKSFRFKHGVTEWNITFLRNDLKRNTYSSWIATPIQFTPASFAYSGKLVWEDSPPHPHVNISVIPFVAGANNMDKEAVPTTHSSDLQTGFDAKVGVTPSLNLDLTVNPDFSQVEVDQQIINLTRFEYKFPERRQFFLENSDLFDKIGFPEARPFFSRRIGLVKDTAGNLQKVPIAFGARLSGSITRGWRLSAMNMQTKEKLSLGLPGQNYSVMVLQHNFWKQSNMSVGYVDKESLGINSGDSAKYFQSDLWQKRTYGTSGAKVLNKHNRVIGSDMELRTVDNRLYGSFFYTHSFDDFNNNHQQAGGAIATYTKRNFSLYGGKSFIQKNFNAEAGYVPSKGVYPGLNSNYGGGSATLYPKNSIIATTGPGVDFGYNTIPGGTNTDRFVSLWYNVNMLNTSNIFASYNYTFQQLTSAFNPIDDTQFTSFQPGEQYSWRSIQMSYQSDQRKLFKYSVGGSKGGFYNGTIFNSHGLFTYRYQPYGSMSVRFDYNDIRLPASYGNEKLFLVSPRMDLTFTDKIFFTTVLQYNHASDNVNLNARFQWRYKPASDFFIVYTENYLPENFAAKNRALVFKLTYWLNI